MEVGSVKAKYNLLVCKNEKINVTLIYVMNSNNYWDFINNAKKSEYTSNV